MSRFSPAELRQFRDRSHCSACVHYTGCALWLSLLLMNEELSAPGLDLLVPDISKPCPMFFPWSSASIRKLSWTLTSSPSGIRQQRRRLRETLGFRFLCQRLDALLGVVLDAVDGAADGVGLHEGRVFEDP